MPWLRGTQTVATSSLSAVLERIDQLPVWQNVVQGRGLVYGW